MSHLRERLKTLKTGLWVQPISRTRFIRCGFLDSCGRFLHCSLFSHPKLVKVGKQLSKNDLLPVLDVPCSYNASNGFSCSRCHGPLLSLEVLILLFLFVVTTPHHHCSVANMAWDRLVSVGRVLTILGFWLAVKTALTFISHASFDSVKKAGLGVHDISLASGCADVLGYDVSPANSYCSGRANVKHEFVHSRGRSLRAVALAARRWSSSMATSLSWCSAIAWCSLHP